MPLRQMQTRSDVFSDWSQQRVSRLATMVKIVVTLALPTKGLAFTPTALQNQTSAVHWTTHRHHHFQVRHACTHCLNHGAASDCSATGICLKQLWRSDPLTHAMKESISCRPSNSVDDRPSTRVNRAATPLAFSFVRSRPPTKKN